MWPKCLGVWLLNKLQFLWLENQRIFELRKCITYHEKGLEEDLFVDITFEKDDWNYYHPKPEINLKHGMSMKNILKILTYYILLKRSRKMLFNNKIFRNIDYYIYVECLSWIFLQFIKSLPCSIMPLFSSVTLSPFNSSSFSYK